MRERQIITKFKVFEHFEDLPEIDKTLLNKAKLALKDAYVPYSYFQVGSAILFKNGRIIAGSNYENASYPLALCAERVTLARAHSEDPNEPILALAVRVLNPKVPINEPASPCGACRQVICETERRHGQDIRIILQGETGEIFVFESAKDLLPFSFNETFL